MHWYTWITMPESKNQSFVPDLLISPISILHCGFIPHTFRLNILLFSRILCGYLHLSPHKTIYTLFEGYWSILRSHVWYIAGASSLDVMNRDEDPLSTRYHDMKPWIIAHNVFCVQPKQAQVFYVKFTYGNFNTQVTVTSNSDIMRNYVEKINFGKKTVNIYIHSNLTT